MDYELIKKAHQITDQRIRAYDNLVQTLKKKNNSKESDENFEHSMLGIEKQLSELAKQLGLEELEP